MATGTTAHILRRLTLGPTPQALADFGDLSPADVIRAVLADEPVQSIPPTLDDDSDFWAATEWWVSVMRDPASGLHERLAWFWHGHLTSSVEKSTPRQILGQLQLIREHALGNFRTLLREITLDPAMLGWLDGAGSDASAPNENYARELMELFALGRDSGAYTEADVRNGAKALAGYWIDGEADDATDSVQFDRDAALRTSVDFLGSRVRTAGDVVDAVCDHPACSRHIALAIHNTLVGAPPSEQRLNDLAEVFRTNDLEIRPLVEAIATHPTFLEAPVRPRSSLEWFLAFERLYDTQLEIWTLESLGQMPLSPPNVAGWPGNERWVSSGTLLTKSQTALDSAWDTATLDQDDPVADVLQRAVLVGVSDGTRAALDDIAASVEGRREKSSLLHAAVAMCPEFSVA